MPGAFRRATRSPVFAQSRAQSPSETGTPPRCRACRALLRPEAIEAAGMICPVGVAEIRRATGEGVGGHRSPGGIGQIRAGFHHDDQVTGPRDVESKLICLHAKAGIASLRLRQCRYSL